MRALLLTSDAYGSSGGIALYNRDVIQAFVELFPSGRVTVVPRNVRFATGPIPPQVDFRQDAVGDKKAWLKATASQLGAACDLIVCGHINLLPVAALMSKRWRAPLVLMIYGIEVWQPHPSRLMPWALRQVDAVWSISRITQDRMVPWCGIAPERFTLLPNAIHLDRYGLAPRRADLIERYELAGRTVILTLARLVGAERYKGIDETLEILPRLREKIPAISYLVAGDGNDRGRLEAKAASLGVADCVVFTGFVAEEEKADLYRLADAFVMPGRGEGFGFVFLEALACGVPAVGSRLDGSREALRDGELGELVDPRSGEELLQAVLRTLAKPRQIPPGLAYFAWPQFVQRLGTAVNRLFGGTPP